MPAGEDNTSLLRAFPYKTTGPRRGQPRSGGGSPFPTGGAPKARGRSGQLPKDKSTPQRTLYRRQVTRRDAPVAHRDPPGASRLSRDVPAQEALRRLRTHNKRLSHTRLSPKVKIQRNRDKRVEDPTRLSLQRTIQRNRDKWVEDPAIRPPGQPGQGLMPRPPSRVTVSPVMYLKSGEASWTHTRPMCSSGSPKKPMGGVWTFLVKASG